MLLSNVYMQNYSVKQTISNQKKNHFYFVF